MNLTSLALIDLLLITSHTINRLCAIWLMTTLSYAKSAGKAISDAAQPDTFTICKYTGLIHMVRDDHFHHTKSACYDSNRFLLIYPQACLHCLVVARKINKKYGANPGDTLGATQQIIELTFYLSTLAWSQNI